MGIPDYDQVAKWYQLYRRLPGWGKVVVIGLGVVTLCAAMYVFYVKYDGLRSENTELRNAREQKDAEINRLNLEKAELHRENLHYKELLDPIQRKAGQLYPELEVDAALAKLTQDIETVRQLAVRDIYRPLSKGIRDSIISGLQAIQKRHSSLEVSISVQPVKGSNTLHSVAKELGDILENAGFNVEVAEPAIMMTSWHEPVMILINSEDKGFVQELHDVLKRFVNTKFAASPGQNFERGRLKFIIAGDPLFSPDGVVTFK
jgi:hypothetical protein